MVERRSEPRKPVDRYCSVKFSIAGFDERYELKVWNKATTSISLLVKENTDILPQLKVGERVNMKFNHFSYPDAPEDLRTVIRHVTKIDRGRLKGFCLVGLEILESQDMTTSQAGVC